MSRKGRRFQAKNVLKNPPLNATSRVCVLLPTLCNVFFSPFLSTAATIERTKERKKEENREQSSKFTKVWIEGRKVEEEEKSQNDKDQFSCKCLYIGKFCLPATNS